MRKTKSIVAVYENGMLKLREKLPLRNHAKVRVVFGWPTSVAKRTQGLLRAPRRTVQLLAEADEFSALNA